MQQRTKRAFINIFISIIVVALINISAKCVELAFAAAAAATVASTLFRTATRCDGAASLDSRLLLSLQ